MTHNQLVHRAINWMWPRGSKSYGWKAILNGEWKNKCPVCVEKGESHENS